MVYTKFTCYKNTKHCVGWFHKCAFLLLCPPKVRIQNNQGVCGLTLGLFYRIVHNLQSVISIDNGRKTRRSVSWAHRRIDGFKWPVRIWKFCDLGVPIGNSNSNMINGFCFVEGVNNFTTIFIENVYASNISLVYDVESFLAIIYIQTLKYHF